MILMWKVPRAKSKIALCKYQMQNPELRKTFKIAHPLSLLVYVLSLVINILHFSLQFNFMFI